MWPGTRLEGALRVAARVDLAVGAYDWLRSVRDDGPGVNSTQLLPFYGTFAAAALLPFYRKIGSLLPNPHPMVCVSPLSWDQNGIEVPYQ